MSGGTGLLLLCEAELSRPMYEIPTGDTNAQEQAKKSNCHSTKGVGQTVPQNWKDAGCVHKDLKGVLMPDGSPGPNQLHKGGYLLYVSLSCDRLGCGSLANICRTSISLTMSAS